MLSQAAVLAQRGYGAIRVGSRGHGRSGGHAMDFGWRGDRDIAAAVSLAEQQPGVQAGKSTALALSMSSERLDGRCRVYRGTIRYSSMRNHDPSPAAISLRQMMTAGSQASQVNRSRTAAGSRDSNTRRSLSIRPLNTSAWP